MRAAFVLCGLFLTMGCVAEPQSAPEASSPPDEVAREDAPGVEEERPIVLEHTLVVDGPCIAQPVPCELQFGSEDGLGFTWCSDGGNCTIHGGRVNASWNASGSHDAQLDIVAWNVETGDPLGAITSASPATLALPSPLFGGVEYAVKFRLAGRPALTPLTITVLIAEDRVENGVAEP